MPLTLTLALGCLWIIAACGAGMAPLRHHWRAAWALIGTGIPLLGLMTFTMGPVLGLLALASGALVLRWTILRGARPVAGLFAPKDGARRIGHPPGE